MNRRTFLQSTAAALALPHFASAQEKKAATKFQIACMTLPYSRFPLVRALKGIHTAGYKYVAWGTTHKEDGGKDVPVLPRDATPEQAKELAARCKQSAVWKKLWSRKRADRLCLGRTPACLRKCSTGNHAELTGGRKKSIPMWLPRQRRMAVCLTGMVTT